MVMIKENVKLWLHKNAVFILDFSKLVFVPEEIYLSFLVVHLAQIFLYPGLSYTSGSPPTH